MKTRNRILSVILALVLCVGVLPMTVSATETNKTIMLGTSVLSKNINTANAPTLHFGKDNTDAPAAWRVIGYNGNGVASASGNMALLARGNMGATIFSNDDNKYLDGTANSNLKTAVDALAEKLTIAEDAAVSKRILPTGSYNAGNTDGVSGTQVNNAVYWPLSTREANAVNSNLRMVDPEHPMWESSIWWLRSRGYYNDYVAFVNGAGSVSDEGYRVDQTYGVRPAFNLNMSSVLFTSAAVGGKAVGTFGTLAASTDYSGNEWKLTLLDSNRDFKVSNTIKTAEQGEEITLNYSGANTGTNEYVSAMILDDEGNVLYYGQIANNSASGTANLTVPTDLAPDSYTLKVFSEQLNGDKKTDYASAFDEVTLKVIGYMDTAIITGVNLPYAGNTLASDAFQYEIPAAANYSEGDGMWYESDMPIETYNQFGDATEINSGHEFKEGKYYTFRTILFGKDGYRFEENMADVTVNGNDAKYNFMDTTENIEVWYSFGPCKPELAFEVTPKTLDFGEMTEGYENAPAAKTVTVTNKGESTFALFITFDNENFELAPASNITVDTDGKPVLVNAPVDGTATFTLQPKKGLSAGTYTATVTISGGLDGILEDFNEEVTATFTVEKPNVIPDDKDEVTSPKTGDNSNIALMCALLFVSGMGIVGTTIYDRKKRTN